MVAVYMQLRWNFEGLRQTVTLSKNSADDWISQESMKFDTLTSRIGTVFLLALAEKKAKWGDYFMSHLCLSMVSCFSLWL